PRRAAYAPLARSHSAPRHTLEIVRTDRAIIHGRPELRHGHPRTWAEDRVGRAVPPLHHIVRHRADHMRLPGPRAERRRCRPELTPRLLDPRFRIRQASKRME